MREEDLQGKCRLDALLVERGLAESRALAQRLIMDGEVRVDGQVSLKPGREVARSSALEVVASPRFVSRGGDKLEAALITFGIEPRQAVCSDVGASTGELHPLPAPARRLPRLRPRSRTRHPALELDIYDRVGGGDGFASGLFYGLLGGEPEQEAVNLGWAHGPLLTTFPGDTTMASLEQVRSFARGGTARIQRLRIMSGCPGIRPLI